MLRILGFIEKYLARIILSGFFHEKRHLIKNPLKNKSSGKALTNPTVKYTFLSMANNGLDHKKSGGKYHETVSGERFFFSKSMLLILLLFEVNGRTPIDCNGSRGRPCSECYYCS